MIDDVSRRKARQHTVLIRLLEKRVSTLENQIRALAVSSEEADE